MGIDFKAVPMELVMNIINIVVLFVLLRILVYKPVKKFMDNRAAGIAKDMDAAAAEKAAAKAEHTSLSAQLDGAREQAADIVRGGSKDAAVAAEKIIADATAEAEKIIADARQASEAEHQEMLTAAKGEIVSIAVDIAAKILEREVSEADHDAMIAEFLKDGTTL